METLLRNKKIGLNYEVLETFEAGLSLFGFEVKALKAGEGSISEAYVTLRDGEAFLVRAHIPAYQPANTPESYDPYRDRKLLLSKKELAELQEEVKLKTLTISPISLYNKGRTLKLSIALVKGKKKADKRHSIKKKDIERDLGRRLKN